METYSSLKAVLGSIAASGWNADLLALTGDVVQDDTREAYEHLSTLLAPLGVPVLCVPGNHDQPHIMRQTLTAPRFEYCAALERGNWLIVGLDSYVPGQAGGRVSDLELERLSASVAASDAEHTLVCLHHPPVDVGSRWLDSVGLENAQELLGVLQNTAGIRALIFGHVHQAVETTRGSVTILGTPSTCRQFLPGSDEFAVDDLPPAYRRIELHSDGELRSELVWVGDRGFEDT